MIIVPELMTEEGSSDYACVAADVLIRARRRSPPQEQLKGDDMTESKPKRTRLFEFYRVFDKSITDTKGDGHIVERCNPHHQRATIRTLSKVCAKEYGTGSYVALEVGETLTGLPLAYWVLKIRAINRTAQKEVFIDDDQLKALRQTHPIVFTKEGEFRLGVGLPFYSAGIDKHFFKQFFRLNKPFLDQLENDPYLTNIYFAQRMVEAGHASLSLESLPDPEDASRRKESPINRTIREMVETIPRTSDKAIIEALVERRAEFWPQYPEARARSNAETSLESYKRTNRKKRQKGKDIRKKRASSKK